MTGERERRLARKLLLAGLLAAVLLGACTDDGRTPRTPPGGVVEDDGMPLPIRPYDPAIDPDDFVAKIDNRYLPLEPGTTFVYRGGTADENETVTLTVTDRTKKLMGVTCTVVKDVAVINGEVAEKTFDWFAQDRDGNVWYFGEATEEYDDGKVDKAGSWRAGVDGALPGVIMLANPEPGDRYRQEFYRGEAEDMGVVVQLDAKTRVAFGLFEEVLVTQDWTPLEKGAAEHKYYAPGIGLVREEALKGDGAVLELISVRPRPSA